MEDQLVGAVEQVVYVNEENGFCVAYLTKLIGKERICIIGNFPEVHAGETIQCSGKWVHHPHFGRQFQVEDYSLKVPEDAVGIQKYLESGLIKGIGPKYAKRIVDHFGAETLSVIDHTPNRLNEIEGVGAKRIEQIIKSWEGQKEIRKVMIFLRSHDVSLSLAQKIFKKYGPSAIEVLSNHPYSIAKTIKGVGFKTADQIAMNLGIEKNSKERVICGIDHYLKAISDAGHTGYPKLEFINKTSELLDVEVQMVEKELDSILEEGVAKEASIDYGEGEVPMVFSNAMAMKEYSIAKEVSRLMHAPCCLRSVDEEKAIEWASEKLHLEFAPEQREAIRITLKEKFHILTGGPGTGKSTITNSILRISDKITSKILLAAPTGKAAKRMSEITKRKAYTIHSLLEFDFTNGGFKRGLNNKLDCEFLIIDESSMIDTHLMNCLLQAIPDKARVLLIGDIDQLPSVGPGNVLRDLIGSKVVPTTALTQIFRQARGSRIIMNAHLINQGKFPSLSNENNSDFLFFEGSQPEEILMKIKSLVKDDLQKEFKLDPKLDIQILSPMRKGLVGTENLNACIQELLNPKSPYVESMGRKIKVADKVMQIRNNYDKHIFNGDIGIVESINQDEKVVWVDYDGTSVDYEFSELDEIVLAYAVSIHKYQGSECPCVIIPIHTSHFKLLYKNLLYTGITRGKKLVVLVGSKKAIAIAIHNKEVQKRYTGLKQEVLDYHESALV